MVARSALESARGELKVWDREFEMPGVREETLELIRKVLRRR